jgi:hypothetical protein
MTTTAARFGLLACILTSVSLSGQDSSRPGWPPAIEPVATPASIDSGQPQLTSTERGVILSWIERNHSGAALRFSQWANNGWTAPQEVASGDNWFVNWADVPSVMRLSNGVLAAHWLQKSGPDTYAYDVRLSYSTDEGKTWAPSFAPHHDGTRTEHGFASLIQMPDAGLGLAWLDGREMKPESMHGEHDANRGAMTLRFATFGRDWKQTSEIPVDLRVCECCPTTAAVTSEGPIVAYRNRSENEVRDIYVSRLSGSGWSKPAPVHDDGWRIPACPVNGPMLSARGRDVAIAWFTLKEEQGRAFVAFSSDAGRTFGKPIRIDDAASLGRVDVELMPDGSAVATWIEFANQRAQFRMRRIERSGATSPAVTVAGLEGTRASGYPRVARSGNELVFAWTESADGRLQVKTATTRNHSSNW